ncbi:hypothetical protein G6L26_027150 (plasmid) [Agrobacterium radiobacter]
MILSTVLLKEIDRQKMTSVMKTLVDHRSRTVADNTADLVPASA